MFLICGKTANAIHLCSQGARSPPHGFSSWIIYILTVEVKDILNHLFCLYRRRLRVKLYCLIIILDGMLPVAALSALVTEPVILFCRHCL